MLEQIFFVVHSSMLVWFCKSAARTLTVQLDKIPFVEVKSVGFNSFFFCFGCFTSELLFQNWQMPVSRQERERERETKVKTFIS